MSPKAKSNSGFIENITRSCQIYVDDVFHKASDEWSPWLSTSRYYNTKFAYSPGVQSLLKLFSPYAAKLTESEMIAAERSEKPVPVLEGDMFLVSDRDGCSRVVDKTGLQCSCTFNSCNKLPCQHIFVVRQILGLPLVTPDIAAKRWSKTFQTAEVAMYSGSQLKVTKGKETSTQ